MAQAKMKFNKGVKVYLVGGAVRDKLLGVASADNDYVVVGSTIKEMLNNGFKQVGKDFPVFIHPNTKEQYALARTERKIGFGHQGFSFDANKRVSLRADLARRDITINAIAHDVQTNQLIDPFGGIHDLRHGIIRHVTNAFIEDPLRILRVARFKARFPQFSIAPETVALMRAMVYRGELATLSRERVYDELNKALFAKSPREFFKTLATVGAYQQLLGEFAFIEGNDVQSKKITHLFFRLLTLVSKHNNQDACIYDNNRSNDQGNHDAQSAKREQITNYIKLTVKELHALIYYFLATNTQALTPKSANCHFDVYAQNSLAMLLINTYPDVYQFSAMSYEEKLRFLNSLDATRQSKRFCQLVKLFSVLSSFMRRKCLLKTQLALISGVSNQLAKINYSQLIKDFYSQHNNGKIPISKAVEQIKLNAIKDYLLARG